MTNLTPNKNSVPTSTEATETLTSPLRCLTGAMISGGMAIALYSLTASIAQNFAAKPVTSSSTVAHNIAVAVRTLVTGTAALATGVFSLVTVGLVALAIQVVIQRFTKPSSTPSKE
ncbi:MAG TPA: DUF3082 domain-containing protein [Oculatellaceae cyanobacterium]|jgi:anti-sigma factor RsiW